MTWFGTVSCQTSINKKNLLPMNSTANEPSWFNGDFMCKCSLTYQNSEWVAEGKNKKKKLIFSKLFKFK